MSRFGVRSTVVVALLLVGIAVVPAGGALAASDSVETVRTGSVFQEDAPANNSTSPPQQENPNQVNEGGNSEALREYLSSQLSEQLAGSSIQISQGQYEDAQDALGEQYSGTLSKYVEVSGGTGGAGTGGNNGDGGSVNEQAEQFNKTAQTQSRYAQSLQNYWGTYEEYQSARENGNGERARRLARNLRSLSSELAEASDVLATHYQNISGSSGVSYQNELQSINNTTKNVSQQTNSIVTGEFTPTRMTASADAQGSFSNPIQITGQVATNGTTPLNGTIQVQTPNQTFQGPVTANGSFTIPYRPTEAPTGQLTANVTYVPYPSGPYLGSNSTIQTNITQDIPSIQLGTAPTTVQYDRSVQVTGQVTVENQSVPNTTVQLQVAGVNLAQTRTNDSGRYNTSAPLPLEVAAGNQALVVAVGETETALAPAENQTTVTVAETPTELTLFATHNSTEVQVQGHLQTTDGQAIRNQPVTLRRNGEVVQSVETNGSGNISATLPLSDADMKHANIEIVATFDGQQTNLASTQATATVTLSQSGGLFGTGIPRSHGLAGGGFLGLVGLAYAFVRRRSDNDESTAETTADASTTSTESELHTIQAAPTSTWDDQLERATVAIEDDNVEQAIRALYGTVRTVYAPGTETSQTHWGFFKTASSDLDLSPAAHETLREVTEAYEAVQFADNPPSKEYVAELVTDAETHLKEWTANRNLNPAPSRSEQ
ncbi:hypothetical protein ACOZ32_14260 (plasmid) [Halobacterium sp. MBLA0001]|nr:hypothetical protein [Halobacterium salinarum]MDL0125599.1 hypothetical protein [Halobacterium salinarum]